jgi:hypothetical protein
LCGAIEGAGSLNRAAIAASSFVFVAAFWLKTAGVAQATSPPLPSTAPVSTDMVDFPEATGGTNTIAVRTITQAGNDLWVGGVFDQIDDPNGNKVAAASGLAPLDATTGALASGVHIPLFSSSTSTPPEVYASSLGANGVLYLGGRFDGVDGLTRHNVAAIDPQTGAVLSFSPDARSTVWSILATPDAVYAGTDKLLSFQLNGSPTVGYVPPSATIVSTLRPGHVNHPAFRDIDELGSTLVSACLCDSLTDAKGTRNVKAVVEIDATTGDWVNWAPSDLTASASAFGIHTVIHDDPTTNNPVIYLAAGGSDFTAAYPFAPGSNGLAAPVWHKDTSGSSQAIAWYQGSLIVGGHFNWVGSPTTSQCGSNDSPNTGCYYAPKLVAINPAHGQVLLDPSTNLPWNPGICCRYNGVWTVDVGNDGVTLNVGGEFDRAGGTWICKTFQNSCLSGSTLHRNYARFGGPSSAVTLDEADPSIAYNGWHGVLDSSASGGSYRVSHVRGDMATWRAPATTSFTWMAHEGPDQGIAGVTIDGKKRRPVDLYAASPGSRQKTYSGLTNQAHIVIIKVSGTKDASSAGDDVSVDAFVAAGTTYQDRQQHHPIRQLERDRSDRGARRQLSRLELQHGKLDVDFLGDIHRLDHGLGGFLWGGVGEDRRRFGRYLQPLQLLAGLARDVPLRPPRVGGAYHKDPGHRKEEVVVFGHQSPGRRLHDLLLRLQTKVPSADGGSTWSLDSASMRD